MSDPTGTGADSTSTDGSAATDPAATDPTPTDAASAAAPPPRRRRRWPFVVLGALVLVGVLGVVALVVVDQRLRAYAEQQVRDRIVQELGLESASDVTVDLGGGWILWQAVQGRLDRVAVTATGADFGEFTGDVAFVATGVPIAEGEAVQRVDLDYRIPEDEAERLARYLSGADLESVTFEGDEVVVGTTFSIFGLSLPVGMSLAPGVEAGALTFTPTTLSAGDAEVSADQLRGGFFGALVEPFLTQQAVCIAESLPAGLDLQSADIADDELVLDITGTDVRLGGGERGACG